MGFQVTCLDLVTLMIILSDNTATNLLIDRLGMGKYQSNVPVRGAARAAG